MKFKQILENKKFLIFLILINILASIIAFGYYYNQLISSELIFWIFIADCPIFSLLFAYALYAKIKGKNKVFLTFFAISGVFKYALWTLYVIFLTTNPLNHIDIVISHILFLLQIIVFYKEFAFKIKHVLLTLILLLVSDFVDYTFLVHPPIDLSFFNEIAIFTVFISIFSVIFIGLFFSKK